ncbi:MAG: DNA polymerase III subunit delta' [Nitrospinae bacterium RIFCSPLOWO2_02_FULL_39_110]|nr:MAG: DNA polymerase III subunit delta' [Nitrospinae bacterium RIFCSPHIGHO2_02_39_11]OGW00059.1 MAG: DNA polymerase III subunit delta' [Nitrospinae bacterium RIFCSPHIGHO2_12_FULL_39_42]OGW01462.1 MAG: DNA polymerase III subunit delta' [Nitrospinae bacterium RIFCSPHIGHO2_02_FULL_39_82]OGW03622.1 MAG: DNA polymerase III subunit delta' [Nitrospinae bacterium RIFCSPLOWO2_02_39_17]OGW05839.1 MAG: DNA polymerase III subunit delta' [Nitrospinae bacterium RIFCSPLOWO2_02_FULL_39_110]OGW09787.1 MAG: D
MSFNNILGQERAKRILENSLTKGTVSHAYLFAGEEGIGKKLTAITFAKALNCLNPIIAGNGDSCDECLSCRNINSLNHPDLTIIKKEGGDAKANTISELKRNFGDEDEDKESRSIKIGAIRELQRRLSLKPYEGKRKIAIIDCAEDMITASFNAFLKTLEEPSGETVIILITSNLHSLLPTIVSRCQIIKFNTLSNEHIKEILIKNYHIKEGEASIISSLSRGRLGRAVAMDYRSVCKLREEALKLVTASITKDTEYIFTESKRLAGKKEALPEFLNFINDLIRDTIVINKTGRDDHIINKDIRDKLEELSVKLKAPFIINMYEAVHKTEILLKKNANPQLAIETMMMEMGGIRDDRFQ